jgi:DtxR family transcriptional regulator, Mn-dependent transcriptional regulator
LASHGIDDYLETIYVLDQEGELVLASRIADFLSVSRPTVSQTMQKMIGLGYVTTGEGREITLTPEGLRLAEARVRKHRLLERWLSDELGLDWAEAHVEASRLESAISPLVEEQLYERLGKPTTCPHGNVIPGSGHVQRKGTPLSDIPPNVTVEVVRIVELAEEDLDLLRFLHKSGIVPGAIVTVLGNTSRFEAGVPIVVNQRANHSDDVEPLAVSLQSEVAQRVLVTQHASRA